MMRRSLRLSVLPLTLAAILTMAAPALADTVQLPTRKAGLWQIQMQHEGSRIPNMSIEQCTDEAVDREFTSEFAPAAKNTCSKTDIQKTATGYVSESVCTVAGATVTSHAETSGDFNSDYTVKVTSHSEGGKLGTRDEVKKRLGAAGIKPDAFPQAVRRLKPNEPDRREGWAVTCASASKVVTSFQLPRLSILVKWMPDTPQPTSQPPQR